MVLVNLHAVSIIVVFMRLFLYYYVFHAEMLAKYVVYCVNVHLLQFKV